ncbi:MAG: sugar transferase [Alphaproteobacteria bacterium]|nr:sugar transferase [Alphaproteobacteria bacterium]
MSNQFLISGVALGRLRLGRARAPSRGVRPADLRDRPHVVRDARIISTARRANGMIKRAFDFSAALAGLIFLSPAMLTIAALIKLQDGGPIFYGHTRIGRNGRRFTCWKLRSMRMDADAALAAHLASNPQAAAEWAATRKLKNDPRITRLGAFLRKSSIDELPQLWNVVRGDMSLVGPRPITREELDIYDKQRRYYLLVRPGITGLWQVSGRSRASYDRRIELDRQYLEGWSFLRDLEILLLTVPAVLSRDGAH